ncbi:MAG: AI-2E family transporter, partial [Mesorhizobium sp.]
TLVANLDDSAREEAEEDDDPAAAEPATADENKQAQGVSEDDIELPDGTDISVLCAGGRGELDDAAAAMLAQVLEVQGATVSKASFTDMEPASIRRLELDAVDTVVAGFLNRDSVKHARFLVRRLKRAKSALRVGIVFWSEDGDDKKTAVELANDINADFVAYG